MVGVGPDDAIGQPVELKHFKRSSVGVNEPDKGHMLTGIHLTLRAAIELAGGRRQNLAHPIGGSREEWRTWQFRHSLPPPGGQIGHQDILAKMQFRLIEKYPSARAPASAAKFLTEIPAQLGRSEGMRHRWARRCVECSQNDLPYAVIGNIK